MLHDSSAETSPEKTAEHDPVVYVETLASADDYWLSITDAARVCRVQDVSIRRSINKGILPVRRQRAGQNKRTRFVRASDLPQAGFPIIDESAAITTEIGKADILSIPRQQQQIVQDHQHLLTTLALAQKTFTDGQAQIQVLLQQQQEQIKRVQHENTQQVAALETRLVQSQAQFQQTLAEADQRHEEEQQATQLALARLQNELQQQELRQQTQLQQQKTEFQELLQDQNAALSAYQSETNQALQAFTTAQQQALQLHQRTVEARVQQLEQETQENVTLCQQDLLSHLEAYQRKQHEQMAELVERLALVQQAYHDLYQHTLEQARAWEHTSQQQQAQFAQLSPLLPYAGQRLATEQMVTQWTSKLTDLENRLLTAQKQALRPYQPLLALLLEPERLAVLARLLETHEEQ